MANIVRVMVMEEQGVAYGGEMPNPDPNGRPMNTLKLYGKGELLNVTEDEFKVNDFDNPVRLETKDKEGRSHVHIRYGSYRRVDQAALPQVIQSSVYTDPMKTAQAQAAALLENAKLEAKRITDEAVKAAADLAKKK